MIDINISHISIFICFVKQTNQIECCFTITDPRHHVAQASLIVPNQLSYILKDMTCQLTMFLVVFLYLCFI